MSRKGHRKFGVPENVILQKSPSNKYREIIIVSDPIVGDRRKKYDFEEEYSIGGRKMMSRSKILWIIDIIVLQDGLKLLTRMDLPQEEQQVQMQAVHESVLLGGEFERGP